jgi:hypothetical protein
MYSQSAREAEQREEDPDQYYVPSSSRFGKVKACLLLLRSARLTADCAPFYLTEKPTG